MHGQLSARQPLLWAALSFAAGLWLGRYMWRPPSWWTVASLVFAAAAMYWVKRRTFLALVLGLAALFLTGALTIQIRGPGSVADSRQPRFEGEDVLITAHVIREGNLQPDAPGSMHQRVDVQTEQIESKLGSSDIQTAVRLNIYSGENPNAFARDSIENGAFPFPFNDPSDGRAGMQLLRYGQRIQFSATLNPPRNFRNPGAFDYAGYLRDRGITATASTKYPDLKMLQGFSGNRLELWRARASIAA